MKHLLISGLATALTLTAPAVVCAQSAGPVLGDPAPPAASPKPAKKGPGVLETLGGAVGGAIAGTAGAAGGPVASAAASLVGKRLGSGAVGVVKNVLSDDDKQDDKQVEIVRIHPPAPAADLTAADVAAMEPVRLNIPPAGVSSLDAQSIQRVSPGAATSRPVSSFANPGG